MRSHLMRIAMHTRMRASLGAALVCAVAAFTAGCGDTDAAVFVEAGIDTPSASVSAATLGTNLSGSFRLVFRLGSRASGPSSESSRRSAWWRVFFVSSRCNTPSALPRPAAAASPGFGRAAAVRWRTSSRAEARRSSSSATKRWSVRSCARPSNARRRSSPEIACSAKLCAKKASNAGRARPARSAPDSSARTAGASPPATTRARSA